MSISMYQSSAPVFLRMPGPKQNFTLNFNGLSFLQGFAKGHFYFHTSMTDALLRHQGAELGKQDFLGKP